jgi:pimeloyl-ACP methyl ester carboxylesterase
MPTDTRAADHGSTRHARRPAPWLALSEGPRAFAEFGYFTVAAGPVLATAPRGDGHRVLVLPGFLADDRSTRPLRWFLRRLDYRVSGWRIGRNLGPTDRVIEGVLQRFETLTADGAPMSLVGWSLGGIYARELARRFPQTVRQVITLGSPIGLTTPRASSAASAYSLLSPFFGDQGRADADLTAPIPVPSTAIYSRADGIVDWRASRQLDGPHAESIEVSGSHCGLGHNPSVLRIVAERLAQPAGVWVPYAKRTG